MIKKYKEPFFLQWNGMILVNTIGVGSVLSVNSIDHGIGRNIGGMFYPCVFAQSQLHLQTIEDIHVFQEISDTVKELTPTIPEKGRQTLEKIHIYLKGLKAIIDHSLGLIDGNIVGIRMWRTGRIEEFSVSVRWNEEGKSYEQSAKFGLLPVMEGTSWCITEQQETVDYITSMTEICKDHDEMLELLMKTGFIKSGKWMTKWDLAEEAYSEKYLNRISNEVDDVLKRLEK